jgi:hypothetical protein
MANFIDQGFSFINEISSTSLSNTMADAAFGSHRVDDISTRPTHAETPEPCDRD